MPDPRVRRLRVWKILAIIAAVLLGCMGALFVWIHAIADRRSAAMERKLIEMRVELRSAGGSKHRLVPGTKSGNAWDDYRKALLEVGKIKDSTRLLGLHARTQNADKAFGETALAAHGIAVDHLRRGASRETCDYPDPSLEMLPELQSWEATIKFSILNARSLAQEGRTEESAEILFALLQFGLDLVDSGVWRFEHHGLFTLESTFDELRELLISHKPKRKLLDEIESVLQMLDDTLPNHDRGILHKATCLGEQMLQGTAQTGFGGAVSCWRFGFSSRILAADAFEHWNQWLKRSAEAERLPWLQGQLLISRIRLEIDQTPFPDVIYYGAPFLGDGSWGRMTRARLRLLRVAVRYRSTGEKLDLGDPFGGRLLQAESGGRLKAWSVGRDGIDHGGVGTWEPAIGKDTVLEILR
jgi:hypothetical protein